MSRNTLRTAGAVTVTAVAGSLGTDVGSSWYRSLAKPRWQPPGPVFGLVWTPLYGLIALGCGRALDAEQDPRARRRLWMALGGNLALNVGWNWLFFRARRPRLALIEIAALEASSIDLTRRAARIDRTAGRLLAPYPAWVAFATALNASIVRLNPAA